MDRLTKAAGVTLRWRPFLLGPIFFAQGWNDSPFNLYPVKGNYMWRDLERICAREDVALALPPLRFPQNGLKAARIALAAEDAPWMPDFVRAVFTANFGERKDISDDTMLADILTRLGADAPATIAAATTPENKARLKTQTDAAVARGLFGAPSFIVGDELFWGNDRLEEAIAWAAR